MFVDLSQFNTSNKEVDGICRIHVDYIGLVPARQYNGVTYIQFRSGHSEETVNDIAVKETPEEIRRLMDEARIKNI
jgi:hypothetical protein